MPIAAAVMSTASLCSPTMYLLHSTPHFTRPVALPDLTRNPQNPVPTFRPLAATCCRLPPPAVTPTPSFLSSARRTPPRAAVTTPASSYASAETYRDEEDDYDYDDDEEWKSGGSGRGEQSRPAGQEQKRSGGGSEAGRLYVGNLPYSITEAKLEELFREAGPVRSVEIVYDRVTDRSRGFGFVTMAGVEEAKEAIRLFDGAQVGGRTVKVNVPQVPRGAEREVMGPRMRGSGGTASGRFVESPHKVYAGNLGWSVTSESLRRALEGLPGFVSARVVYDRETGRSRGFGFVSFESEEDAQSAVDSMNGAELEGRPIRMSLSIGRAPTAANTFE